MQSGFHSAEHTVLKVKNWEQKTVPILRPLTHDYCRAQRYTNHPLGCFECFTTLSTRLLSHRHTNTHSLMHSHYVYSSLSTLLHTEPHIHWVLKEQPEQSQWNLAKKLKVDRRWIILFLIIQAKRNIIKALKDWIKFLWFVFLHVFDKTWIHNLVYALILVHRKISCCIVQASVTLRFVFTGRTWMGNLSLHFHTADINRSKSSLWIVSKYSALEFSR